MKSPNVLHLAALSATLVVAGLAGCHAPGKPGPEPEIVRPEEVRDFTTLYKQNCAGCHGAEGHRGLAVSLANPVYLSLAGREELIRVTSEGVKGQLMPAFARSKGGMLTDEQVAILADGILARWSKPHLLDGQAPPPLHTTLVGDAAAGGELFKTTCVRCHNQQRTGPVAAGPLDDPSYLALISDQSLRSTILSGRPDEGMPDWRSVAPAPLSDQQVTNLVAWLASRRTSAPGQPYPDHP